MKTSIKCLAALALMACALSCNKTDPNGNDGPDPAEETVRTDLSAYGTANCYIVSKAGAYQFDAVVRGCGPDKVGEAASAEVLWESFGTAAKPAVGDVVKSVSLSKGRVLFETPKTVADGNALIAVKDASGNILWSWHVWVCADFDPAKGKTGYAGSAGAMMDRNLGAFSARKGDPLAFGLLYQWGRKDPFMGGCSTTGAVAASTITWPSPQKVDREHGTVDFAIAHPTTFIGNDIEECDWLYFDVPGLWTPKSVYDPCPKGWRIPDGGGQGVWAKAFGTDAAWNLMSDWDSANLGMDFGATSRKLADSGQVWYPAAGYRDITGTLCRVGDRGHYWSGYFKGANPMALALGAGGMVDPAYEAYPVFACSVRCEAE